MFYRIFRFVEDLNPLPGQEAAVLFLSLLAAGIIGSLLLTYPLIGWLSRRQYGKTIRVDGPDHAAKAGTPTMGGLGMLAVLLVGGGLAIHFFAATNSANRLAEASPLGPAGPALLLVLAGMLVFAGFGLMDDLAGLARRRGQRETGVGLGARQMLALQLLAALMLAGLSLRLLGEDIVSGASLGEVAGFALEGQWIRGLPLFALISLALIGTVNGVNLSDGLDGLAAGLLALAFLASVLILLWTSLTHFRGPYRLELSQALMDSHHRTGQGPLALALFAALAAGACLGFLWYNRHPARVFMGNVASMGLGGALAMIHIVSGLWWLLPIVGAVFVAEVLSVIIQVGYFKWSGGKRVFRMAPFHHHFELGGMHETQVVRRFWIAGALSGLLAIALFVRFVA